MPIQIILIPYSRRHHLEQENIKKYYSHSLPTIFKIVCVCVFVRVCALLFLIVHTLFILSSIIVNLLAVPNVSTCKKYLCRFQLIC